MTQTVQAFFDGEVLRPEEPIELAPNTRVRVTIETSPAAGGHLRSFLDTARGLNLEGPADWSEHIEDYLDQSSR